MVDSQNTGF